LKQKIESIHFLQPSIATEEKKRGKQAVKNEQQQRRRGEGLAEPNISKIKQQHRGPTE